MRVIVTGGSGKIGGYAIRELLEAGHEVVSLDARRPAERLCRFVEVDLTDPAQLFDVFGMIRPEGVVHAAANPDPHGHPRHRQFLQNVGMTHAAMQVAGDLGARRFVYVSSEQANGWSSVRRAPARVPFDEDDATVPPNDYALSKLVGETIAAATAARHPEMGLVSLRINYVLLPEDHAHMAEVSKRWPGSHMNLWAYVDARDAASAIRLALEGDRPGHRVYMVSAADTLIDVPTREAIARHFGEGVEIDPSLPEFGAAVDCRRIEQDLGWRARWSWRRGE